MPIMEKIVLQFPRAGEKLTAFSPVSQEDGEKFVAFTPTGAIQSTAQAHEAFDFETYEKARNFAAQRGSFVICRVKISVDVQPISL